MKKTLALSDKQPLLHSAVRSCQRRNLAGVEFACSPRTTAECEALVQSGVARKWDIKAEYQPLLKDFGLVISLHCRQIFPQALVSGILFANCRRHHAPTT